MFYTINNHLYKKNNAFVGSAHIDFTRYLTLIQSNGGTITASNLTGYAGDTSNLSYTANPNYYFQNWSNTGGNIQDNTFTYDEGNASVKANFIFLSGYQPYKLTQYSGAKPGNGGLGTGDSYYHNFETATTPQYLTLWKYMQPYSANLLDKNYFVFEMDSKRNLDSSANYAFYMTNNNVHTQVGKNVQSAASSFSTWFDISMLWKTNGTISTSVDNRFTPTNVFNKFEYLNSGFSGGAIVPPSYSSQNGTYYKFNAAQHLYGRRYCYGYVGERTLEREKWGALYKANITVVGSGINNYSGLCLGREYGDNEWVHTKLVVDMNNFAWSAYEGSDLVYTQRITNVSANGTGYELGKLLCFAGVGATTPEYYWDNYEGTTTAWHSQSMLFQKNISFTYFYDCDEANQYAKYHK